jgi:hypothetical protein
MTVVDPAPAAHKWKSFERGGDVASALVVGSRVSTAAEAATDDSTLLEIACKTPASEPAENLRRGERLLRRIRSWILVPLVDFVLIMIPLAWRPNQIHAVLTMALLATMLLTGGGRHRARLHLSVLDELPTLLTRLLTATAAVASIALYLHQRDAVIIFLQTAGQATALVVIGRVVTTRLISFARRRGIVQSRTVLIGGGPLAAELAKILEQHPMYGQKVVGFVDDGEHFPAEEYVPRLGRLDDLDIALATTDACTLLVADGSFDEHSLMDAVRTEECQTADLLVVPRMHYFHTQTGLADHIGSIPIMRIRNPDLQGSARMIERLFDIAAAVAAFIVLMPVMTIAALAARIEGGPGIISGRCELGVTASTLNSGNSARCGRQMSGSA